MKSQIIRSSGPLTIGLKQLFSKTNPVQPLSSTVSQRSVVFDASPKKALQDIPSRIFAADLPARRPVTVSAEVLNEKGLKFQSHAFFETNSHGEVDLSTMSSLGGSYKGIYPMGLIVGLSPTKEKLKHVRLHKKDNSKPWKVQLHLHEGHTTDLEATSALASMEMVRQTMLPGVTKIPIKKGRVRGALYLPPGPGPHPGIIDIYGAAGGLIDNRAALQASRGFASLAIAYFGYDDLSMSLKNIELELFEEAVDVLTSFPDVIPDRCGVFSSCMGGQFGLSLLDHVDKVTTLVTVNGAVLPYGNSVTYKGKVITPPEIELGSKHMNFDNNLTAWLREDILRKWLEPESEQMVTVNNTPKDSNFLLISGTKCALGGPLHVAALSNDLLQKGYTNVQTLLYEGAGHIIEPPYSSFNDYIYNPYFPNREGGPELPGAGCNIGSGGSVEGNHDAMQDMWPKVLNFLTKHVRDESLWYQEWCEKQKIETFQMLQTQRPISVRMTS